MRAKSAPWTEAETSELIDQYCNRVRWNAFRVPGRTVRQSQDRITYLIRAGVLRARAKLAPVKPIAIVNAYLRSGGYAPFSIAPESMDHLASLLAEHGMQPSPRKPNWIHPQEGEVSLRAAIKLANSERFFAGRQPIKEPLR